MANNQTFNFDGKNVPLFALESTVQQLAHSMQQIAASTMALGAINAGTKFAGMQNKSLVSIQKGMNKNIHDMHHVGIAGLNKTFLFSVQENKEIFIAFNTAIYLYPNLNSVNFPV